MKFEFPRITDRKKIMLGHIYHILYTEHHRRIRQTNTAKKKDKLPKIEG